MVLYSITKKKKNKKHKKQKPQNQNPVAERMEAFIHSLCDVANF